jgi:hypothetical protein
MAVSETQGISFEALLADPDHQFDLKSDLLASIVEYAKAQPDTLSAFTKTQPNAEPTYIWLDAPSSTTAA